MIKLFLCKKEIKDIDFSKCVEDCNKCEKKVEKADILVVETVTKLLRESYG